MTLYSTERLNLQTMRLRFENIELMRRHRRKDK